MGKYKTLLLFVFMFVLTRIFILLVSINEVYNSEDLAMGTAGREIMQGAPLPWFEYQYLTYSGGTLIDGIAAAPFFMLLGQNYFALKLVPLLFSALTLAVLFLFSYEYFSPRAAVIAALLYIFSCPAWCGFNLFLGFHTESLFFVFLSIWLFYGIIFGAKAKTPSYLMLGLVCGFGTYFSYTFLIAQAAIMFIWFIHDRKFFLRGHFYLFLAGWAIGMLPWLFYNLTCGFKGVSDVLPQFSEEKHYLSLGIWINILVNFIRSMWFPELFRVEYFNNRFLSVYSIVYVLVYWFCFFWILRENKYSLKLILRSRELLLLLYPLMLLGAIRFYGAGSEGTYLTENRYLIGLFPFVFLTVSLAADRILGERAYFKRIAVVVFLASCVVSAASYLRRADFRNFASGFRMPGYSYLYLSETFNFKYPDDLYKILDNITSLREPQRHETLALRMVIDLGPDVKAVDFTQYLKLSLRLKERFRPYFYKILLWGMYYNSPLSLEERIAEVRLLEKKVEPGYIPYLYEGLGASMVKYYGEDTSRYGEGLKAFDEERYRQYYCRGLSVSLYPDDIPAYISRVRKALDGMEEAYRGAYLEGSGEVLAKFAVSTFMVGLSYDNPGLKLLYEFINSAEDQYKLSLLRGSGQCLSYFYGVNTEEDVYRFVNHLKPQDRGAVLKAMESKLKEDSQ